MKKRAYCFDLDGTLADSASGIAASLNHAVLTVTGEAPVNDWQMFIGPPLDACVSQAMPYLSHEIISQIVREFRQHYDSQGLYATTAFPDACLVLGVLAERGVASYVITNKPTHAASRVISHLGLEHYVKRIIGGETEFRNGRASSVPKAERAAQLAAEEAIRVELFIGDGLDDLYAAQHIGSDFCLAEWGYGVAKVISEFPAVKRLGRLADLITDTN